MKKIGIFVDEIKDRNIEDSQKFSKVAYNTGNMLFWYSLKALLNLDVKSRWYISHADKLNLGEYKAFVTTDLVWIRQMQDFSYLNKTLDALGDLPLIPISAGLQSDGYLPDFKLHPGTVKLLGRICERCVIGVRGEYTAEILNKYGIRNFKIIGCPSMYMNAAGLASVNNEEKPVNKVSMNFETFYGRLTPSKTALLEYGAGNGYSFVEQAQAPLEEKHIADREKLTRINKWLTEKSRRFFDVDEWRKYFKDYDFSFGMRFHGNVIALWENVPALFVTCDSRTKELCGHFSLPEIDVKDFDKSKPIEYYYRLADYDEFHRNYPKRLEEWREFLKLNDITVNSNTEKDNGVCQTKKEDLVLYHVGHFGFLINCLLHKLVYHPDAKAVFMLDKVIANRETVANLQKVQNNFAYIGTFFYYNDWEIIHNSDFEKNPEKVITEYFDNFLGQCGIGLSSFSEIYSVFDTYCAFGAYLSIKGVRYNMIESTPCQCRNRNRYFLNTKIPKYDEIIEKYSCLSADSEFCKKLISYDDTEYKAVETVYDNAPNKLIKRLSSGEKDKLISAYEVKIRSGEESALYILQSGYFSGQVGLPFPEGYLYINKKILDLFTANESGKIIIKPHPNSDFPMEKWEREFPGLSVIPGYFPSFLVPYIKGVNISKVITTGSSGSLEMDVPTVEIPCQQFFPNYLLMNKLYVAVCLSQYLKISKENFFHYGLHNKLTWRLTESIYGCEFNSTWSKLEFPAGSLTIIDNIFWNEGDYLGRLKEKMRLLNNNAVIAFINSGNDFVFLGDDMNFLCDIYELRIKKRKLRQDCFEDMNDEVIYIFCKDGGKIQELKDFLLVREFFYQGYAVSVKGIESDKRISDLSIKTDYLLAKSKEK